MSLHFVVHTKQQQNIDSSVSKTSKNSISNSSTTWFELSIKQQKQHIAWPCIRTTNNTRTVSFDFVATNRSRTVSFDFVATNNSRTVSLGFVATNSKQDRISYLRSNKRQQHISCLVLGYQTNEQTKAILFYFVAVHLSNRRFEAFSYVRYLQNFADRQRPAF